MRRLEEDFKEKFNSISLLVNSLEISLKQMIDQLHPEELENRVALLEEYRRVLEYKEELESIDDDIQACEEAADWLDRNRKQLISYAIEQIFCDGYRLRKFGGIRIEQEVAKFFCQDLDSYFRWIGHYLRMGTDPEEIPKGVISLVLPPQIYLETFQIIRNDRVAVGYGLSERAVVMLTSYINKFLMKRDLDLDKLQI